MTPDAKTSRKFRSRRIWADGATHLAWQYTMKRKSRTFQFKRATRVIGMSRGRYFLRKPSRD